MNWTTAILVIIGTTLETDGSKQTQNYIKYLCQTYTNRREDVQKRKSGGSNTKYYFTDKAYNNVVYYTIST